MPRLDDLQRVKFSLNILLCFLSNCRKSDLLIIVVHECFGIIISPKFYLQYQSRLVKI